MYEASEFDQTQVLEGDTAAGPGWSEQSLTPAQNWRSDVLRRAMYEDRLPGIRTLIAEATFRGSGEALAYAMSRYLCLFLYQRGVLSRYYAALREQIESDPTGGRTLLEVCAAQDWQSLDRDFRAWLDAQMREGFASADT